MMTQLNQAILFSYGLFAIYLLLPIIPTVLIFKLLPDEKVAISGPLQKLTINASGAFAAYIITLLLGVPIIGKASQSIDDLSKIASEAARLEMAQKQRAVTWNVTVPIKFTDTDGTTPLQLPTMESMYVLSRPSPYHPGSSIMYVDVPIAQPGKWPTLMFNMSGFLPGTADLMQLVVQHQVDMNESEHTITLHDGAVQLVRESTQHKNKKYILASSGYQKNPKSQLTLTKPHENANGH